MTYAYAPAFHDDTTFVLGYAVDGTHQDPVPVPCGLTSCIVRRALVTVVTGLTGDVVAEKIVLQGDRARKDGTPGLHPSSITFWPNSPRAEAPPDWIMDIVLTAVARVEKWVAS